MIDVKDINGFFTSVNVGLALTSISVILLLIYIALSEKESKKRGGH